MNVRQVSTLVIVTALVAYGACFGLHKAIAAQPGRLDAEDGIEILTRGPVHEAFAGTVTFNPELGIVVPRAPSEAIEELPPEQRPEGDNVAWIPGYWAWDDERNDFLWVSGIWRNLPPGRQWVPGYWGESGQDYQWTSGYWADATVSEVEYLPEPPASVEVGPNIVAPTVDETWIPGCWVWQQTRYAWSPGYWAAVQPNWVWVPAYYVWSPRGYVFVDGYWDYSVARRGVLFAPVYFDAGVYSRPGFYYSPATVINPAVFASQLFLRPTYQHYYFGDYYAVSYSTAGFYPWFSYNSRRYGYDPIYAHERWQHRQDREWERQVQADFRHRRDHEEARPPRTWAAQRALVASQANSTEKSFVVAAPLAQLVKSPDSALRFQPVAQEERQELAKHGQEIQKFRQERQKLEAKAAVTSAADPSRQPAPARLTLPTSPIVARSADQFGRDQAPPKRYEAPQPDPKVEPQPNRGGRPELPTVSRPGANRPDTDRPALPRTDVGRSETNRPGIAPQPGATPRAEPRPRTSSRSDGRPDRSQRPSGQLPPGVSRPSDQPRPYTTNRLPLDAERPLPSVQPRGNSPRAEADPVGPARGLRVDQPIPQAQPERRVDRPAPQRVDRAARQLQPQPQKQPQPRVEQPQPKIDRPEPTPRIERPAQPQQVLGNSQTKGNLRRRVDRPAPQQQTPPQPQAPPQEDKNNGNGKATST